MILKKVKVISPQKTTINTRQERLEQSLGDLDFQGN